ncbi:DNA-binding domain-containing protein, AraC-type [Rivularia sp. PCC 7116]|uniref:helix-turn-helix domain-containing protein n=1 Tax=Rivularia sp. PCC 7116 TaxID=373994 RepID=UPI00029EF049|nr:AraC family transcriptional regulator [Rivularia sp. PCC 7116]AFY53702.1 DNA-binding domain-containing protein, AraC-type [Rivularia sp. PCC 7116]
MQNNSSKSILIDFNQEKEEEYKRVFNRSPLVSSQSVGWDNLTIIYDRQPPIELPKICLKQHCIGILTDIPLPMQTERIIDGCFLRENNVQGDLIIVPANTTHQAAWYSEGCSVAIAIDPVVFAQTIYEVVDPDKIELLPKFANPDPFVYQIGVALKSALIKHGTSSRLYAETLINALILHLLENYSTTRINSVELISGKLPQYKLQQIIDYIQAYLDTDLSLNKLAASVQMSPHYFSRLFKETTGFTPHKYVIRCRIERAQELLKQGKLSIAEIANSVGFVDQSHLNRHFKRLLGITPKDFSQQYKTN